ncbi:MAG: CYTH and CHAD domain-containing protein [Alphaproteobacteria bacterium]|nr:CYTH and CHAD domain-containing protein [Alphaproteobacteria bacterium]
MSLLPRRPPAPAPAGPPAGHEVELKLALDPADLPRLKQHPLLRASRPSTTRLEAVYFDTSDLRLAQRNLTLRVRRAGHRHVQTVKSGSLRQIGLFEREESEQRIAEASPDPQLIGDAELRRAVGGALKERPLKPIFGTAVLRTKWRLGDGGKVQVEVDLDVGHLKSGAAEAPICEIELELKRGRPRDLIRLARDLGRLVPLRLDVASKAARGFALYRGDVETIRQAEGLDLARDATLGVTALAALRESLAHVASNQAAVLAGRDVEGVHQMRVGLRRFRAALGLFRHQFRASARDDLAGELRWLAGTLAPARAWDVFLAELLPPVAVALAGETELREVERAGNALRELAYAEARTAIGSGRFLNLMLSARLWLAEPPWAEEAELGRKARDVAAEALDRRHRKAKRLARDADRLEESELHALRLRLKKLRYAAEFFAPLFAQRRVRSYMKSIGRPQQSLGHLNDARSLRSLLDPLAGRVGAEAGANALGALAGFHAGRVEPLLAEARREVRAFADSHRFWA